jgi:hypothetical protein
MPSGLDAPGPDTSDLDMVPKLGGVSRRPGHAITANAPKEAQRGRGVKVKTPRPRVRLSHTRPGTSSDSGTGGWLVH